MWGFEMKCHVHVGFTDVCYMSKYGSCYVLFENPIQSPFYFLWSHQQKKVQLSRAEVKKCERWNSLGTHIYLDVPWH